MVLHWIKYTHNKLESASEGRSTVSLLEGNGLSADDSLQMIWREQESSGIHRIPEESGVNTGIPVPQEFLQKNSCKIKKKGITATPSKTTFLWKIPHENAGKTKNPQESSQECFFGSKK